MKTHSRSKRNPREDIRVRDNITSTVSIPKFKIKRKQTNKKTWTLTAMTYMQKTYTPFYSSSIGYLELHLMLDCRSLNLPTTFAKESTPENNWAL